MDKAVHESFMRLALEEAKKGFGKTSPNPMVGSVLVKNGDIIARGFHEYFGGPHAEVNTLSKYNGDMTGTTLYVTLEPCSHTNKKTPPCCQLLMEKRPERIVIGQVDPNPEVNGKGIELLRSNGIEVLTGILEKDCLELNIGFNHFMKHQRAFVHLKMAVTLDGKCADDFGNSKWISSDKSRHYVHTLRNKYDAVAVGSKTASFDNPKLNVRDENGEHIRCGKRLLFTHNNQVDNELNLFTDEYKENTIIVSSKAIKNVSSSIQQLVLEEAHDSFLDQALKELPSLGVTTILLEGGPQLASAFMRERLVDKISLFIAPKIFGKGKSFIENIGIEKIEWIMDFTEYSWEKVDTDMLFEGIPNFTDR